MSPPAVYLLPGARTPYTKAGTLFKAYGAHDLAAHAFRHALARSGVAPEWIDEVVLGNIAGPAEATNVARVAALIAGLPVKTPGLTVNRNCGSGLSAAHEGYLKIISGEAEMILCGGAESMSQVPLLFGKSATGKFERMFAAKSTGQRLGVMASFRPRDFKPEIGLLIGLTDYACGKNMGETAETLAREWALDRAAQDAFAARSHARALAAQAAGYFNDEIAPLTTPDRKALVSADNGPRADSTPEKLGKLRTVFQKQFGTVTAGNASQLTDGAAAFVLASAAAVQARGLTPLARVAGFHSAGCDPARMGLGPAYAIPKLLARLGWRREELDRVEVNEAFAAQCLAVDAALRDDGFCRKELGLAGAWGGLDWEKTNVQGGAIALGHPVGSSGARLMHSLAHQLKRTGGKRGVASLCIGGGQGVAAALERC